MAEHILLPSPRQAWHPMPGLVGNMKRGPSPRLGVFVSMEIPLRNGASAWGVRQTWHIISAASASSKNGWKHGDDAAPFIAARMRAARFPDVHLRDLHHVRGRKRGLSMATPVPRTASPAAYACLTGSRN